jgi:anti-anti-sigma factor
MNNFITYELDDKLNFSNFRKVEEDIILLFDKIYEFDIMILDFERVTTVDTIGLGVLVNIQSLLRKLNKIMILKSCSFIVREHIKLNKLEKFFNFYEDTVYDYRNN